MNIDEIRKEFPILQNKVYLNSCSLGALSKKSRSYVMDYLDLWDKMGASAWYEQWMGAIDDVRRMVAQVLGADTDEIALGQSISGILSSLGSCFDFGNENKNEIVLTDMDFPTANYQWFAKEPLGAKNILVESPDRIHVSVDDIQQKINEKTALISTSHVFFLSGYIQDIKRINEYARQEEAICIFDAYQSVGQVPVDVHEMDIDALACGGLKWLLGGSGITYLYVKKELAKILNPTIAGWFGVENQFDFEQCKLSLLENTKKFETGTPSASAIVAAKGGLEMYLDIGQDEIFKATKNITEELIHLLQKEGFELRVHADSNKRSSIVMIVHDNPGPVVLELAKRDIIVDYRKDCIRVSPYFYNNSEDLEKLVKNLVDIVGSK